MKGCYDWGNSAGVKCLPRKREELSLIPDLALQIWCDAQLLFQLWDRRKSWSPGACWLASPLYSTRSRTKKVLNTKIGWMMPEERHPQWTSEHHTHLHLCAPTYAYTRKKQNDKIISKDEATCLKSSSLALFPGRSASRR